MNDRISFTLGSYLRRRRLAQGIGLDHEDFGLESVAVEAIETDVRQPTLAELYEYYCVLQLDFDLLFSFALGGQSAIAASEECCRVCACGQDDACHTAHGPCAWSQTEDQVCTACEGETRADLLVLAGAAVVPAAEPEAGQ